MLDAATMRLERRPYKIPKSCTQMPNACNQMKYNRPEKAKFQQSKNLILGQPHQRVKNISMRKIQKQIISHIKTPSPLSAQFPSPDG